MLQRHYQLLSRMSVDSVFDANWKEEVEDNVNGYSNLSEEVADSVLDKEIKRVKLQNILGILKIARLVVVME